MQFGGEMKWLNEDEVGEKSRLHLTKIIRTAFENDVDKCESSQLAVLDGVSASQDDKKIQRNYNNSSRTKGVDMKDKISGMQD